MRANRTLGQNVLSFVWLALHPTLISTHFHFIVFIAFYLKPCPSLDEPPSTLDLRRRPLQCRWPCTRQISFRLCTRGSRDNGQHCWHSSCLSVSLHMSSLYTVATSPRPPYATIHHSHRSSSHKHSKLYKIHITHQGRLFDTA